MKIAIFTDIFLDTFGGIPSSIAAQKAGLEKLGHQVTVFCPGFHQPKDTNIVVVPTRKWPKPNGAPLAYGPRRIENWLWANVEDLKSFEVFHVHYEASVSIAGVRLAQRLKIPLVQTMHGREDKALECNIPWGLQTVVGKMINSLHDWYLPHRMVVRKDQELASTSGRAQMWTMMVNHANFAQVVITPSMHFAQKLQQYGVKRPIEVVSNGIDDEIVAQNWPLRKLEKGKKLKIIWNSRVSKEKRIMPFLAAVAECRDFVEVSVYGDGNELERAKKFVREKNLEKIVKLFGATEHSKLFEKMRDQHLSVMASYGFDTQGMTLLEAEATGLPVFFCDPDMAEVVPTGVQAAGPGVAEMVQALRQLYQNPQRIEEMSAVMLKRRQDVAQSTQLKKLLKIYRKLID